MKRLAAALVLALAGCHQAAPDMAASSASSIEVPAPAGPKRHVLAIGDSLFAGYGLASPDLAYPARLQAALRRAGVNADVANASVSGDTTADGAARLGFSLDGQAVKPDLVLICLGGNDMLRGLPPASTRANMEAMLGELDRRHIPVVVMGMLAAPNLGVGYARAFDAVFPAVAREHHAALVPFFLSTVMGNGDLRQADHMHPTPAGVEAIVKGTLPVVEKALAAAPAG